MVPHDAVCGWDDGPVTTEHPHSVRTFKRRVGRLTSTQEDALSRLWSRFGLEADGSVLDLPAVFGRSAPVVLEIGFGMGEATALMAQAQPGLDVLAADVHTPGHGNLLKLLEASELTNVRLVSGDARVLLAAMLPAASLRAVRVFFPDPWPKRKHHKRRLVTPAFVALVASRLEPGGTLHLATDWADYAEQMLAVCTAEPTLRGGVTPRPHWRPVSKFEQRAREDGRTVCDLLLVRSG